MIYYSSSLENGIGINPTPVKAVLSTGIPAIDQSPGLLFSGRETIRLVMDTLTCMTGLQAHDTYTLCTRRLQVPKR